MIVQLYKGISRIAFKLGSCGTALDRIELIILPGQHDTVCTPNGSPWVLTGCWPGKTTDVDLANWRPDFTPIQYVPFGYDAEGRVMFLLDERLYSLPCGRYTGIVRVYPEKLVPLNMEKFLGKEPVRDEVILPPGYDMGCCPTDFSPPPPPAIPEPPKCTNVLHFDIDLNPPNVDSVISETCVYYDVGNAYNVGG